MALTHTRINVRAVIQKDDKILLCRFVDKQYFFLPGGGMEFTESAEGALRRELREELGVQLVRSTFIGAAENLFEERGKPYHEVNLVFSVEIDNLDPTSHEVGHVDFSWMSIGEVIHQNVLPKDLVAAVAKWWQDKKAFWVGQNT